MNPCDPNSLDDCGDCKSESIIPSKRCSDTCISTGERCKRYGRYEFENNFYCRQHYLLRDEDPVKEKTDLYDKYKENEELKKFLKVENITREKFKELYPTNKKLVKYVEWIIKSLLDKGIKRLEDIKSRAYPGLERFEQLKTKNKLNVDWDGNKWTDERDINNYCGIAGCKRKGKEMMGLEDVLEKYEEEIFEKKKYESLAYDGYKIKIYVPKSQEEACYYGRGTRWCTAAKKENMFYEYNNTGRLYIVVPKKPEYDREKYQFHYDYEDRQFTFMDEKDEQVPIYILLNKYKEIIYTIPIKLYISDGDNNLYKRIKSIIESDINYNFLDDLEYINTFLRLDEYTLGYIENQTEKICETAVFFHGMALKYVKKQTKEICMIAVKSEPLSLHLVDKKLQDEEMVLEAIKRNPYAITYARKENITEEVLLETIKRNGFKYIIFSKFRGSFSFEFVLEVVKRNGLLLNDKTIHDSIIKFDTDKQRKIYETALDENYLAVEYVPLEFQSEELWEKLVKVAPQTISFIPEQFWKQKLFDYAVKTKPELLKYVPGRNQTEEMCLEVVKKFPKMIRYVVNQTEDICIEAVKGDPLVLEYIFQKYQTDKVCILAVKLDYRATKFIIDQNYELFVKILDTEPQKFTEIISYIRDPKLKIKIRKHSLKIERDPGGEEYKWSF